MTHLQGGIELVFRVRLHSARALYSLRSAFRQLLWSRIAFTLRKRQLLWFSVDTKVATRLFPLFLFYAFPSSCCAAGPGPARDSTRENLFFSLQLDHLFFLSAPTMKHISRKKPQITNALDPKKIYRYIHTKRTFFLTKVSYLLKQK